MAKGKESQERSEIERIIARLRFGQPDDQVILFVPSHDKSDPPKRLNDQDQWASDALDLMGDLYGGSTATRAVQGVWKDDAERLLYDVPIMVQSLAQRDDLESEPNLKRLLSFAKRMGRETNQAAVAITINDAMHLIRDYKED